MNRTLAAYFLTCEEIFKSKKVYFWTLTFVEKQPVWCATYAWARLQKDLNWYFGKIEGVRVSEMHELHGMHFHLLINRRIPIGLVLRLAARYGFGRIEVDEVRNKERAVRYLSKYLRPGQEKLPVKGMRRWSRLGGIGEKVSDMVCMSQLAIDTRAALKGWETRWGRKPDKRERYLTILRVRREHDMALFARNPALGAGPSEFALHDGPSISLRNGRIHEVDGTWRRHERWTERIERKRREQFLPDDHWRSRVAAVIPGTPEFYKLKEMGLC